MRTDPAATEQTLAQALRCYRGGDHRTARRLCEQVLSRSPANGAARHIVGLIAVQGGDLDIGIGHLELLCAQHPRDAAFRLSLAKAYGLAQRKGDAVAELAVPARSRAPTALPPSYRSELARLLFWALLPFPLVVVWYALLFRVGGALLGTLLPELMIQAIGAASALVVASWLALVYGAIPFVAHHRALRQHPEVSP